MATVNKVQLLGNLGNDPEIRTTPAGKTVASFSLATQTGYGDNAKTEWHSITAWEKTADAVGKFLKKGSKVFVEGRISYETSEKDGVKRYFTKIVAYDVQFLDSKPKEGSKSDEVEDDGLGW